MKVSLSHSSYVIDLNDLINTETLSKRLEGLLNKASTAIHNDKLNGWRLVFVLLYNGNTNEILVFKKTKSNISLKEKLVVIHIPIPDKNTTAWGVDGSKIVKFGPLDKRYYNAIVNDFTQSNSLEEHCYKSAKAGILYTLLNSLTISGQNIQVEKNFQE